MSEWNDALEAAAKLIGGGFTWVRRPTDKASMQRIEVHPGHIKVKGKHIDAVHCGGDADDYDVDAILSLRREK